jgi:hypothetical protein
MGLDVRTRPPNSGGLFLSSAARLGAVPAVTTVTAHFLDYCFAVIAPSSSAVRYTPTLGPLKLALFLYGESACPHSLGTPC